MHRYLFSIILLSLAGFAAAETRYATVDLGTKLTESAAPYRSYSTAWRFRVSVEPLAPRVEVPGAEAFLAVSPPTETGAPLRLLGDRIVLSYDSENPPRTATLIVGNPPHPVELVLDSTMMGPLAVPDEFHLARAYYYRRLAVTGVPGARLFEVLSRESLDRLPERWRLAVDDGLRFADGANWDARFDRNEFTRTFELFSGGRALVETLQPGEGLAQSDGEGSIPLQSIKGVTTKPFDWAPYIGGKAPKVDALAATIPLEDLAVFFPSWEAYLRVTDTLERDGNPMKRLTAPRAENERTGDRYRAQLCLPDTIANRLLGGTTIDAVALTAGDPYLREGTDVAVLLQSAKPDLLVAPLLLNHDAALKSDPTVTRSQVTLEGHEIRGIANPRRTISSWYASTKNALIVSNSPEQLVRILQTGAGRTASLGKSSEYTFFRDRYALGAQDALAIVSDEALRKWTGPKWRIAESRRLRAAATMLERTVHHRDALLSGVVGAEGAPAFEDDSTTASLYRLTRHGIAHRDYGSLAFLTPISELRIDTATKPEALAYDTFRERYEQFWRRFFDPIAIEIAVRDGVVSLDTTILPLIAGSDYNDWIELTSGGSLRDARVRARQDALFQYAMHLNPKSRMVERLEKIVPRMDGLQLRWVGDVAEAFLYDSEDLRAGMAAADPIEWLGENWMKVPFGFRIAAKEPLGLATMLAALRRWIDDSSPGLVQWGRGNHAGREYVTLSSAAVTGTAQLQYLTSAAGFTIGLTPETIHRSIALESPNAVDAQSTATIPLGPWLGDNVAAVAHRDAVDVLSAMYRSTMLDSIQRSCFRNLPILNELRRRYPQQDAAKTYRMLFGAELECPAGGQYVWNASRFTYESTALGNADEPKPVKLSDFFFPRYAVFRAGVTFEMDGLRARLQLEPKR